MLGGPGVPGSFIVNCGSKVYCSACEIADAQKSTTHLPVGVGPGGAATALQCFHQAYSAAQMTRYDFDRYNDYFRAEAELGFVAPFS